MAFFFQCDSIMCHLRRKLTKCSFHIRLMCLRLIFSSHLQLVATARSTKIIKTLMSASRRPRFLDLVRNLSILVYNRFVKCEAIVQGDVQGITTLVGRRLGKTLTSKLRVWDLAMFTNDTQDKKDARR